MLSIAYVVYPTIAAVDSTQPFTSQTPRANSKTSEVFRIIIEKNHVNTTFIVSFAESALTTNSTLMLPTNVIKAIHGSSSVVAADSNGSYGEVDYYQYAASYIGGLTHYHLSAADAINTDTALKVLAALVDVLGTIISAVTGGLAIGISVLVGWITTVTAINYDAIYSADHNPDKSFDFWTYMVVQCTFWDFDYVWTPYHCWFCTLVGAYIVTSQQPLWADGGAVGLWKVLIQ